MIRSNNFAEDCKSASIVDEHENSYPAEGEYTDRVEVEDAPVFHMKKLRIDTYECSTCGMVNNHTDKECPTPNISEKIFKDILKVAAVIITRENGEMIIQMRQNGNISFIGGKVDPGETPFQAAVRETREETGLVIPNSYKGRRRIIHSNKSIRLYVYIFELSEIIRFEKNVKDIHAVKNTDRMDAKYSRFMFDNRNVVGHYWVEPIDLLSDLSDICYTLNQEVIKNYINY
jgi:mutator protein MutT